MAQRQSKSRKGATSRGGGKRQSDGFHVPGWLWGLVGVIAGFAGAQYLQQDAPDQRDPIASIVTRQTNSGGASDTAAPGEGSDSGAESSNDEGRMPTFEFYTLLPESEVIAPNSDEVASPRPGAEGAVIEQHAQRIVENDGGTSPTSQAGNDADGGGDAIQRIVAQRSQAQQRQSSGSASSSSQQQTGNSASYMLQAASFQSQLDADNMAGRLRDLGLVAQVTRVRTADNTTWYRVQAGPYQDSGELARARGLMQARGIEPMQIRQR
ncbi:SPOR domain-containing protein [Kushneria aurantia]|uniref:SPOR domain-containing protein n=1 Tax=Kushneria aurantia TaxID=504092 RepID=A0ABV6G5G2_9GAMM|nr:SPOR domain-containing protein [Kushneria aurantia]